MYNFPELLYWSELHPKENGNTIVYRKNVNDISSPATRITQEAYNVADTVHEYGGAAYFVNGGTVYFMNAAVSFVLYISSFMQSEDIITVLYGLHWKEYLQYSSTSGFPAHHVHTLSNAF